ncbi:MAG: hypothetical protein ABEI32_14000 [Halothece sp.]
MSQDPIEKLEPIKKRIAEIQSRIQEIDNNSNGFVPEMFQQYGQPDDFDGQFEREKNNRDQKQQGEDRLTKAISDVKDIKKQAIELEKLLEERLEEFRRDQAR